MSERERENDEDAVWLLARERGQPGPVGSEATAARYAQLQALIADLPATPDGVLPHKGWQQDVLAAIDAEADPDSSSDLVPARSPAGSPARSSDSATPKRTSTRPRRWAVATALFAMAVAAAVLVAVHGGSGGGAYELVTEPPLALEIEPANRLNRGSDPSVGDKLIVRGVVGGLGELRVYDGAGVERARCAVPAPDCTVVRSGKRTTFRLTMLLRAPGALYAVLFAAPLGGPSRGMDDDVEAAVRAGIVVTTREPVDVH